MADLRISQLSAISAAELQATDPLAVADLSASETKKVTVKDLIEGGVLLIDDASIPSAKVTGITVADGSITTAKLDDEAVTAAKISDNSIVVVGATLPVSGDYIGQLGLETTGNTLSVWSGSAWVSAKAAGSINAVSGDGTGLVPVSVSTTSGTATVSAGLQASNAAAQFLAGPTAGAGAVSLRTITAADLPTATTSAKGAVSVNGQGLTLSGNQIVIDNTVAASATGHLVTYDAQGLITGGAVIASGDLPLATSGAVGAVRPGTGLSVGVGGVLNHTNVVTPATATKVTYNADGHITGSQSLISDDIPSLDASKITTGTFSSARLAENSVTAEQLADYGIAQVSSTQPTPEFAGQLWINPTDRTAYVWVGQVNPAQGYFLPLNNEFGAQANLRFGGTYNASTNLVASLNTYGAESGLSVGSALVSPTANSSGVYLLVTTAGTGTSPAPAVALDVGDWILSPGSGTTWTHVNLVGAGISVIDAEDVTFDGSALSPAMSGVADAGAAITTLWGRVQIATPSTLGVVLETTEIAVNNSTGAMTVGTVDEGTY